MGDTVLAQLAHADIILLNKIDLVSPERLSTISRWLGATRITRTHCSDTKCRHPARHHLWDNIRNGTPVRTSHRYPDIIIRPNIKR